MKILWISFIGSWTFPLLNQIKKNNETGIIIPNIEGKYNTYKKEQISFFELSLKKHELYENMNISTFMKYKKIIDTFNPDIIHIHGTEKNLAQIQNYIKDIPIVISIQGLLTGCKKYTFNYLETTEVKKNCTLKNRFGFGGIKLMDKSINRGKYYELDILKNGKYFIGRTYWDKAHVMFNNTKALYYHGEELLREEFYNYASSWDIKKCQKHTIFMPSGFNPIKGLHLALKTVYLLKQYFPDVELIVPGISTKQIKRFTNRVYGEEYIIYCVNLIKEYGIESNIKFLSRLDAKGMTEEMQKAHVFLSPTSIDNSPNAVGEATMIGVPIVTTPVGGIPSILKDENDVLFAPAGDPYMMAYQIKRIFEDDNLATMLSNNAYQTAIKRHDIFKTVNQYNSIYEEIIMHHNKKYESYYI